MMNENIRIMLGRVCSDVKEIKNSGGGCWLLIAVPVYRSNGSIKTTQAHRLTFFPPASHYVNECVKKGDIIFVTGRHSEEWREQKNELGEIIGRRMFSEMICNHVSKVREGYENSHSDDSKK